MLSQAVRGLSLAIFLIMLGSASHAAQYAALVMDARTGKIIHSRNADMRLHPASLTKMMTLYLVFEELRQGRMSLDQKITISRHAAGMPPSKLGLKAGQQIELRYLIRAAAVKSANDAAAALAEAVSGSEAAFARKMTAAARTIGMRNTTFKNASGLTANGHLSTARDMAILGRQLFYDFPQYYNLFSRRSTNAKVKTVYNTNRKLLDAYPGADGIKTGFTRAAGYNLVSSAERGGKRVIVSLFGGKSTASRNKQVAELMDLGLRKMNRNVRVARPSRPILDAPATAVASVSQPVARSFRPEPRPGGPAPEVVVASAVARALTDNAVTEEELVAARAARAAPGRPRPRPATLMAAATPAKDPTPKAVRAASTAGIGADQGWVLQIGGKHNRSNAERVLLTTALQEMEALEGSRREMQPTGEPGWYRARFVGLSQSAAEAACARLAARQTPCQVMNGS